MKWCNLSLLLLLSIVVVPLVVVADEGRAELRVPFTYEMHLNSTEGVATNIEQGLQVLETEVQARMLDVLNGSTAVEYTGFEYRPYDTPCEADKDSDDCRLLESDVIFDVPGSTDEVDASFATLEEVKAFVKDFNVKYDQQIFVGYRGPFHFNLTFVVYLEPVERKMNDNEIAIFEHVWLNLLKSYESNVEILKVSVIYQHCPLCLFQRRRTTSNIRQGGRMLQRINAKNAVFVKIDGQCYDCSSDSALYNDVHDRDVGSGTPTDQELSDLETQFTNQVQTAADDPAGAGLTDGEKPTNYFDEPVSATIAAVEEAPEAPVDPDSVEGLSNPLEDPEFNWAILGLLGGAVAIVLGGFICVVVRRGEKAKRMAERDPDADDYLSGRAVEENSEDYSGERAPPGRSMEDESVDGTMVYTTAGGEQ